MCPPLWIWLLGLAYMTYLAWQDWRARKISGLGAKPLFVLAWPIAYTCGWSRLLVAAVFFVTGLVLWRWGVLGGEDTRALPFVAALAPDAIVWGGLLHLLTWPVRKILGKEVRNVQDPGFVIYTLGLTVAILLRVGWERG